MKPKAIDLFSGCGGLSLGLNAAGFETVLALDKWDKAIESYNYNLPGNHGVCGDVAGFDFSEYAGKVTLIAGGPPCQGHSTLIVGKRAKKFKQVNEARNSLALDFVSAIEVVRPRFVLMENVVGFPKHPVWGAVYSRMRKAGYAVNAEKIYMADYGIMQNRVRFIMLAQLGREILPFPRRTGPPKNCVPAFQGFSDSDKMLNVPAFVTDFVKKVISYAPQNSKKNPYAIRNKIGFGDNYGRIDSRRVSNTITGACLTPSAGRFAHPWENRGLNAREALRLQSFPDSYSFPKQSNKDISQQIGNAFPPKIAEVFGFYLLKYL